MNFLYLWLHKAIFAATISFPTVAYVHAHCIINVQKYGVVTKKGAFALKGKRKQRKTMPMLTTPMCNIRPKERRTNQGVKKVICSVEIR